MYADLGLDNKILKDVIEKKTLEPEINKEITKEIINEHEVSIARACRLMIIHRSYFYFVEKKDDYEVHQAIKDAFEFGDGFGKYLQEYVVVARYGTIKKFIGFISLCTIING